LVAELQRASHRFDADLDEDAGRLLDVVARRLNKARRLAQLREDSARTLGRRGVREERLAGEARGDEIGVELRVPLPRPDDFELEHAGLEVRSQHPVLEAFDRRQRLLRDLVKPPEIARQRMRLAIDGVPTEVLEEVVVRVYAVQRRVR